MLIDGMSQLLQFARVGVGLERGGLSLFSLNPPTRSAVTPSIPSDKGNTDTRDLGKSRGSVWSLKIGCLEDARNYRSSPRGRYLSHSIWGQRSGVTSADGRRSTGIQAVYESAAECARYVHSSLFNETSSSLAVMGERNSRFASIIQARGASPETPEI